MELGFTDREGENSDTHGYVTALGHLSLSTVGIANTCLHCSFSIQADLAQFS